MMQRIAGLLIAIVLASSAHADWTKITLPDGTFACQDKATKAIFGQKQGLIYYKKSQSSQATQACNVLTPFVPWLGTAEAQVLTSAIFHGQFPDNVPVGSPPAGPPGLSPPWLQTDVGTTATPGNCTDSQGQMTNIAGGGDFHKDTSVYHLCYQEKSGDWQIDLNIISVTGADEYRKCGPVIVDELTPDSKYAYMFPSLATGNMHFGDRPTTGADVYENQYQSSSPFSTGPVRMTKVGGVITGYVSYDGGMTYVPVGSSTWAPSGTVYIGQASASNALTTSTCVTSIPTLTSLATGSAGVVNFKSPTSTVREDGSNDTVCLVRSVDTSGAVSVHVNNAGTGTAVAGTDFTNVFPVTVSWGNGIGGDACFNIPVANRSGSQPSRTINLSMSSPTGGVTIGSAQPTHAVTITDKDLVAISFQPGWYAGFNKTCIPSAPPYGCTKAEILNTIATEICPNANLVGMKMVVQTSFLISNTPGVYTATGPDLGFAIFDPVLDALAACGKYLILQGISTFQVDQASATALAFPTFTYPSSWSPEGTATGGAYGLVWDTQSSQPGGMNAAAWQTDWRDLAIAAQTAYCSRYGPGGAHPSSAFYAFGLIYWNTSLPFNNPLPPGYDEATFNNRFREYLASARSACPTINLMATLDFANPNPAQMSTWLASINSTSKAAVSNNDVWVPSVSGRTATWGQQVYTGVTGSPSVIDYRGVVRYIEEVETPDMCGSRQTATPAQLFNVMQNGDGPDRARWPNEIVVFMGTECDVAGTGWAAWKSFIASKSGMVMNGRDSTLRTPAAVKASWCENGMTCQ